MGQHLLIATFFSVGNALSAKDLYHLTASAKHCLWSMRMDLIVRRGDTDSTSTQITISPVYLC